MKLMRHGAMVVCAFALTGLVMAAPAGAVTTGVGTGVCHIGGKLVFNPPLTPGGTQTDTVTLSYGLTNCSNGTGDAATITGGSGGGTFTTPNNDCTKLSGTNTYVIKTKTNWTVKAGSPALAPTISKLTKEVGSANSAGVASFKATGKVTSGSFTGDLVTAKAVIQESESNIIQQCSSAQGLSVLHIVTSKSTSSLHH